MSALQDKIKNLAHKTSQPKDTANRITNDTVAQHREQILQEGRKFKYPLQHTKRRIVIVTSLIVVGAIALFGVVAWWQLYKVQATGAFMYRVTTIIPFPVASIDGAQVRYNDYLNILRSNMHYLSSQEGVNFKTEDGKRQLADLKERALSQSVEYAEIKKIAREKNIAISDQELEDQVQRIIGQQSFGGGVSYFSSVLKKEYDQTYDQWKDTVRLQMLRNKVYAAVDTKAQNRADAALKQIKAGTPFSDVAKNNTDDTVHKNNGGDIGVLEKGKADLPPELSNALFALKKGEVSAVVPSKQGLFILKAIETDGSKTHAAAIFFKYTAFDDMIKKLQSDNKVKANIPVKITVGSSVQ